MQKYTHFSSQKPKCAVDFAKVAKTTVLVPKLLFLGTKTRNFHLPHPQWCRKTDRFSSQIGPKITITPTPLIDHRPPATNYPFMSCTIYSYRHRVNTAFSPTAVGHHSDLTRTWVGPESDIVRNDTGTKMAFNRLILWSLAPPIYVIACISPTKGRFSSSSEAAPTTDDRPPITHLHRARPIFSPFLPPRLRR